GPVGLGVEISEEGGGEGRGADQVEEFAERMRSNDQAVVGGFEVNGVALFEIDVQMIGPESDHYLEELSPAVDSAQQRVACNLFTQHRLFIFVTGSGFVMQSFKPSRPQVAQRVVNLFWRKLLFDPG